MSCIGVWRRFGLFAFRPACNHLSGLVRRNQRLVRLNCEADYDVSLEVLAMKTADDQALRLLFARWGFKSLLVEPGSKPVQIP